jgi:hypothetical protein
MSTPINGSALAPAEEPRRLPPAVVEAAAAGLDSWRKPGRFHPVARLRDRLAARRTGPAPQLPATPTRTEPRTADPQPEASSTSATPKRSNRTAWFVVPLILTNTVAVFGQVGWAHDHLHVASLPSVPGYSWASYGVTAVNFAVALMFAAVIESIGLYLSAEAHAALLHRDPALKLRLASYAMGGVAGAINYSHYAAGWHPTTLAVALGLMSTISPWLWAIRARSRSRAALVEQGLIDARAAHFSGAKWINFPVHTLKAFRLAVSTGETREREAWQAYWQQREQVAADKELRQAHAEFEAAVEERVKATLSPTSWTVWRPEPVQDPVPVRYVEMDESSDQGRTDSVQPAVQIEAPKLYAIEPPSRPAGRTDPAPSAGQDSSTGPSNSRTRRRTAARTGSPYESTLRKLRRRFPDALPTVDQVKAIDGQSRGRAGAIRKALETERQQKAN